MQELDASVITAEYSAEFALNVFLVMNHPKSCQKKRCCVLREIPVLWHLLSCWYEPKKLKEQNFQLSSVTKQRPSLSLVPTKGRNSKQSPDSSHRFSLDKQHPWVSWIITISLEKVDPNLNPSPTRRHKGLKEWDGGTQRKPLNLNNNQLWSPTPESSTLPCWAATLPLLTARQKGLHELSNNPKQKHEIKGSTCACKAHWGKATHAYQWW